MNKKEYLKWIQDEIDTRRVRLDQIVELKKHNDPNSLEYKELTRETLILNIEIGIYKKCYNRSIGR